MATPLNISAVIEKYRKLVYAICIGVVNDAHLAEDITQDVFERLIKNADTVLALNEPKQIAYISIVAKNRAIDVSKKERTQRNIADKVSLENSMTMDIMVNDTFVDEHGFSIEMRDIILKLDSIERDVIIAKYGLGYTYREIAALLGLKERYIYYKVKMAHRKLYRAIVEEGRLSEK